MALHAVQLYYAAVFFIFFITNLYVCIYLCHMVDTFTMILYLLVYSGECALGNLFVESRFYAS